MIQNFIINLVNVSSGISEKCATMKYFESANQAKYLPWKLSSNFRCWPSILCIWFRQERIRIFASESRNSREIFENQF